MWKFIAMLLCATVTTSVLAQGGNYFYPVPAGKGLQEVAQPVHASSVSQQQPQYQQQHYQQHYQQQQQQYEPQQQQPRFAGRAFQYPGAAVAQYQQQQQQPQPQPPLARQFSSSALESAAFKMALRNQGLGGSGAGTPSSASSGSKLIELRSLNIKLPVPIGIMPINAAPLPIQAGTPYAVLRGVNSYGTLYPQR